MADDLIIKITAQTDKAEKDIKKLEKAVNDLQKTGDGKWSKNMSKGMHNVSKSANTLTKTLGTLATTWLTFEAGKNIVQTAADIEEGFLGIAKTTGMTGEALDDFSDKLLELSTEMGGISIEELQKIAETAGQLGITGSDNILKFTKTIAMVGATTEMTAEQAATAFAKLSSTMGVPIEDVDRLASSVNELSNTTAATAGEIVNMSQRMAGAAKEFGLTADQVAAISAALTEMGMQAELGGTAMQEIMLKMIGNVEGFAKASGKSFTEFSELIKNEPVEALEVFLKALSKMDTQTKLQVLDDLKLKGSGVTQTLLKLSGNIDLVTKSLETSSRAFKENKSIQEEYDVFQKGFNAQMERVGNTVKALAAKIGTGLLPKIEELANKFREWVNTLSDDDIKVISDSILNVGEAIGELFKAAENLNDILMPDWLGGEGSTFFGEVIRGWTEIFKRINKVVEIAGSIDKAFQLKIDVDNLDAAVKGFDGLAESYDKLAGKAIALLEKNHKLQDSFRNSGSDEAKAQLASLKEEEERLMTISMELAKQRPLDMTKDSAKEANKELENINKLTLNDKTIVVDADTTPYDFGIKALRTDAEGNPIDIGVNPEYVEAEKKIDAFIAEQNKKPVETKMTVDADTKDADKKVESSKNKTKKPVTTKVNFDIDTSAVDKARQKISEPITVPVYYKPMNTPPSGTSTSPSDGIIRMPQANNGNMTQSVNYAAPIAIPATTVEASVNLTLNIDGQKLKALIKNGAVKGLEEYLTQQGGW